MGISVAKPTRNILETKHTNQIENQIEILDSENFDADNQTMSPIEYITNEQQRSSSNITGIYARRNQRRRNGIIVAKTSQIDDEIEFQDEN
ncbi:unnamed protein product [Paramecium octaurelia]|uniref:Uncharacterized protein n=1 Tax=Paramecium octaurelia TaxID=43137 RepID=A0A8S1Y256_PAROT|nr:unnamed protein product [Paramecium octaurelia]